MSGDQSEALVLVSLHSVDMYNGQEMKFFLVLILCMLGTMSALKIQDFFNTNSEIHESDQNYDRFSLLTNNKTPIVNN